MFNNNLLSDVTFVVRVSIGENESKKAKKAIPAHRFVLAIGSPVFFAMFCGSWRKLQTLLYYLTANTEVCWSFFVTCTVMKYT